MEADYKVLQNMCRTFNINKNKLLLLISICGILSWAITWACCLLTSIYGDTYQYAWIDYTTDRISVFSIIMICLGAIFVLLFFIGISLVIKQKIETRKRGSLWKNKK
ncbi:MAG: hypothetical protein LBV37_02755 [Mycoplasmataceae bacterium]|jgi:hypothetical protein|nr:hypothetical protein [Mycoplasmataceae bacterium]